MSNHLSEDQFAKCIAGSAGVPELEHISGCRQCSAELERFRNTLGVFRNIVRSRIDARIASHPAGVTRAGTALSGFASWRPAWLAAAVVALIIPLFINSNIGNIGNIGNKPQQSAPQPGPEMSADAIMQRVNFHLSRTVPAPMEPIMPPMPEAERFQIKSGGVQ